MVENTEDEFFNTVVVVVVGTVVVIVVGASVVVVVVVVGTEVVVVVISCLDWKRRKVMTKPYKCMTNYCMVWAKRIKICNFPQK